MFKLIAVLFVVLKSVLNVIGLLIKEVKINYNSVFNNNVILNGISLIVSCEHAMEKKL